MKTIHWRRGGRSTASSRCSIRSSPENHRSSSPTRSTCRREEKRQIYWPRICPRNIARCTSFRARLRKACVRWYYWSDENWKSLDEKSRQRVTQLDYKKQILRRARRIVVKIGSQILSSSDGIEETLLKDLVRQLAALHEQKKEIVVVSSGAVAAGMTRLGRKERPKTIPEKQALAAVGQIKLMALYERYFSKFDKSVAQVLLTHEDLANRQRYINAKHTFQVLLESAIIPIVNENDTVAVEEMKFGDNDHLSALVATLLEADLWVSLSDVEGVYDCDPRTHANASLFPLIKEIKEVKAKILDDSRSSFGTGGITTKIGAAEEASAAGIPTVITSGLKAGTLTSVFDPSAEIGTLI